VLKTGWGSVLQGAIKYKGFSKGPMHDYRKFGSQRAVAKHLYPFGFGKKIGGSASPSVIQLPALVLGVFVLTAQGMLLNRKA